MGSQTAKEVITATDAIELSDLLGTYDVENMFVEFLQENPSLNPIMMARVHGYKLIGYKMSDTPLIAGFIITAPDGRVQSYSRIRKEELQAQKYQ